MWHPCTPVTQAEQNADVAHKPELSHSEASHAHPAHSPQNTHIVLSPPPSQDVAASQPTHM